MNYCILPNINYNTDINSHFLLENILKPYNSHFLSGLSETDMNDIIVNKTLYKYLSLVKEQIDCRLEQWDKYKKYTNPYEYIHTTIPNTKQAVSTLKPCIY